MLVIIVMMCVDVSMQCIYLKQVQVVFDGGVDDVHVDECVHAFVCVYVCESRCVQLCMKRA